MRAGFTRIVHDENGFHLRRSIPAPASAIAILLIRSRSPPEQPRDIWPELASSGARSTKENFDGPERSGATDFRPAFGIGRALRNSVRSSARMTSEHGMSSPYICIRSISTSKFLRACGGICRRYCCIRSIWAWSFAIASTASGSHHFIVKRRFRRSIPVWWRCPRNVGASALHRALPRSQTRPSTMPFNDR